MVPGKLPDYNENYIVIKKGAFLLFIYFRLIYNIHDEMFIAICFPNTHC